MSVLLTSYTIYIYVYVCVCVCMVVVVYYFIGVQNDGKNISSFVRNFVSNARVYTHTHVRLGVRVFDQRLKSRLSTNRIC